MRRATVIAFVLLALVSCSREGGAPVSTASVPASGAPEASPAASGESDPAKAAFVKAANAACREYADRNDALPDPEELDDYVSFLREFIRIGDELQAKLRALAVPPADRKGIEGYLAGNDQQARVLKDALPKLEAAVGEDDSAEADDILGDAIDRFNEISESQDPFARSYGLTDCANPPDVEGSSTEA